MSTKNKKSSATGVRYTDAQKKEVVDYVVQYNAKNGRGGQSQAVAKYKLSAITCASWLKAAGIPTGKGALKTKAPKAAKAPKAPKAAKAPKAPKAAKAAAPAGLAAKVASLVTLNDAVRKAESELEKLYTKQDALMASIKGWI